MDTLWYGDEDIRKLYTDYRKGANRISLPGYVPTRFTIPDHPYRKSDLNVAKRHKRLPPRRDANGAVVVPVPAPPPPSYRAPSPFLDPAAVPQYWHFITEPEPLSDDAIELHGQNEQSSSVSTVTPIVAIAEPQGATAATKSSPETVENPNLYRYHFWPPWPWHGDPDTSQFPTLNSMKKPSEGLQNRYLDIQPLIWQTDDDHWRGACCFSPGAYRMAALYCRVADHNNVKDVSTSSESDSCSVSR